MPILQLGNSSGNDERYRTFVFQGEGHTLGNALHNIISRYPNVEFCGYSVPHPTENCMNLRIQMKEGRAIDALEKGIEDLMALTDHILECFTEQMQRYEDQAT